jgi:hypothetical protein
MLVKDYDLHYPNGTLINISADYEGLPSKCSSCNIFRHTTTIFPNNKVDKLWTVEESKMKMVLELSLQITSQISYNGKKLLRGTKALRMMRMVNLCLVCINLIVMQIRL